MFSVPDKLASLLADLPSGGKVRRSGLDSS
jgi:hypothetical protein